MKRLLSLTLGLVFVAGSWSCSLPPGSKVYSLTQRVVLAPRVIHGVVLNISALTRTNTLYEACVQIIEVIKGPRNLPNIVCFGTFGPDYLCKTDVYERVQYIFFLEDNLKARYEDQSFPMAAAFANPQTVDMAKRGVCDPNTGPQSACVLPSVKPAGLHSIKRIKEGQSLVIPCQVRGGTKPAIVQWSKRGAGFPPPTLGDSLQLLSSTISDMGTYVCTISNPAGKVTQKYSVFVLPEPCGAMIGLKTNENTTISSPRYPRRYSGDKMCSWRICPAVGQRVELNFQAFDLQLGDSVEIYHECDPNGAGRLKYCYQTSPGKIVSRCTSSCVQFWFMADNKRNYRATGFLAHLSSTSEGTTIYDYRRLYCGNPILIRFIPKVVYGSEMQGTVLFNYKGTGPSQGQQITISIGYNSRVGLFGCYNEILSDMEYYVGATVSNSNEYTLRFFLLTDSKKKPIMFDKYLNEYKVTPPACDSPTTLPPYSGVVNTRPAPVPTGF